MPGAVRPFASPFRRSGAAFAVTAAALRASDGSAVCPSASTGVTARPPRSARRPMRAAFAVPPLREADIQIAASAVREASSLDAVVRIACDDNAATMPFAPR